MKLLINVDAGEKYCGECKKLNRALGAVLNQENSSITSTGTNWTTDCPICGSLAEASMAGSRSWKLKISDRKCVVCGNNCGKPSLLDLFSGAGGAARGYQLAGFCVLGIDNKPQRHYAGCRFHLADALEYCENHGREFDVIHASPPCQAYSVMTNGRWKERISGHVDLISKTRSVLINLKKPYIIENVVGSPLINPFLLCGTMFGLETISGNQLRRHRLFESSVHFWVGMYCKHNNLSSIGVYGGGQHPKRQSHNRSNFRPMYKSTPDDADFGISARKLVMGIDWMVGRELNQAIPPAYTEYIGKQLIKYLEQRGENNP